MSLQLPTSKAPTEQSVRPLDEIDRRMLMELSADARIPMVELAERVGVSRANAHWRVARLRESGVIKGFTTRIQPRALGLEVAAVIMISVEQGSWRTVRSQLEEVPEIEYIALTSGDSDFLLVVRAHDMTSIRDVVLDRLQSMPGVRSTKTIFVLDEARRGPVFDAGMGEPA